MNITNQEISDRSGGKPVVELCFKCHKLYIVPKEFLDLDMAICLPCFRKIFGEDKSSNNQKEENQSNSLPFQQSGVCQK